MSVATRTDDLVSQLHRAHLGADSAEHEQLVRAVKALHDSELRFRDMIDALPAAIYTTDAGGKITHFNRACVEFSGRMPELGTDHWCVTWKLYYPDGRPMPHDQCPMAVALRTGQAVRGAEAIAERPDGTRVWFMPYPTPLFDENGKVVGGINMLVDITQRKTAESAGAYLAAIVESSDDAIITKSLDSIITTWNASAERLFGYTAEEAIGKPITILIPPDRLEEEPKIIERLRRGERVDHFETKRVRKDGTLLDISLTVSPVKDSTGRIVGASKVARDITERKRAEKALEESEERLTRELAGMKRLHELSVRLAGLDNIDRMMAEVMEAACELVGAKRCTAQVLERDQSGEPFLRLVAFNGFEPGFAAQFRIVTSDGFTTCAAALGRQERVIVEDLLSDPEFARFASLATPLGIRGVMTTPLLASDGALMGLFTTYWDHPHLPDEHQLRVVDLYAQQAARELERRANESALRDSENQLETISNAVPALISYVDTNFHYVRCNDAYTSWFGLSRDQLIGKTMPEVLGDEAWRVIGPHIQEAIEGRPAEYEAQVTYKHGGQRWIHAAYRPHLDAAGKVRGVVVMVNDITVSKHAEQALRDSEHRFRVMADTAPAMLWITGDDGACTFRSRGWYEYTGQTEANGLGSGWIDAVHPSDREIAQQRLSEAIARREPFSVDYRLWHVGNEYRWCIDAGRPRYGPAGEFQGYIGSVIDVHERKLAEQNLKEADRRKDEFLATLAHELRNPLAPIRNSLHVLRMTGTDDPAARDVHEVMERQVKHMVRLVDDLLEISRITSGKIELRTEPIDLASVVRSAVEISKPAIEAAGIRLSVSTPAEPVRVEADGVRLSQVLANLLNNAAKFTERRGNIWLNLSSDGGAAQISVRDNGIGISAEMLPRVFEMFTQVDRAKKRSQGGLGIGLALAKRLVEMHGGQIEAKSAGEGQGSEFIVRLPLIRTVNNTVRAATTDSSKGNGSGKNRILVVDDNKDAAASLGMLLRMLGHDVQTATNGASALEAMPAFRPSVVLLDLGMPGMSGFEVAQRARQLPECRDAVLIALTGWGQEEDRQRSREAGFDHHLVKPVDLDALGALLQGLHRKAAQSVR